MSLWRRIMSWAHDSDVIEAQEAREDAARRLQQQRRMEPRVQRAGDILEGWVRDAMRGGA